MSPNAERRFLTGLLILAAVGLILILSQKTAVPDAFGGLPYPRHVRWTQYTVPDAGWLLVRPTTEADNLPDSMTFVSLLLPPGTEVYVPRIVAGPDPDAKPEQNRSTSR